MPETSRRHLVAFADDAARRAHYRALLAAHLQDPAFRAQPGFPIGSDADILDRSDPPFYTACPNPFITELLADNAQRATSPAPEAPFAADTRAGKTHPLYTAHAYHSKVPHEAIVPYVLHFTRPGDVVFDGFAGSGMTGLAAQLCGQPEPGLRDRLDRDRAEAGLPPAEWGPRRAVLVDLSPVAGFIGYNLNVELDAGIFRRALGDFFAKVESELGVLYETTHSDGRRGRIDYTVWSEVLVCPHCRAEFPYVAAAHDPDAGSFKRDFACPACDAGLKPRQATRKRLDRRDPATGDVVSQVAHVPVAIHYRLPGEKQRFEKAPDAQDLGLLARLEETPPADWFPTAPLPLGAIRDSQHLADRGVLRYHHFYFPRALHALAAMWRMAHDEADFRARQFLLFMVEQAVWGLSRQNRYGANFYSQANRFLGGVYYLPPACSELSPWAMLGPKARRLEKLLAEGRLPTARGVMIGAASTPGLALPPESVDYIYTDPPFGDAIKYGDLNLLIEAWHRLHSRVDDEVLWDELKAKGLDRFSGMLATAFKVYHAALKPGRWMTVVFHNSNPRVWDAIQEAIVTAGFVVADVRTLDRRQGSFNQVTAAGSVKNDLVISAYKPAESTGAAPLAEADAEAGWAYLTAYLAALPESEITGRSAQMLYSKMVAQAIQSGRRVPLAASAFYECLDERFDRRGEGYYAKNR